ncbi:NUDIX family hydrolase [Ophiocordyceps camponoti-floridani]|uniref:NUDIX family hydrolase n=1 Tax=Ophiocordyceps camponoti-floridani TaxID=2030778 RepID=A0A8H4QAC9_9HYPO|nr:NUDIX family hydrolase [Ophiocordyceps camponoti-floridani]
MCRWMRSASMLWAAGLLLATALVGPLFQQHMFSSLAHRLPKSPPSVYPHRHIHGRGMADGVRIHLPEGLTRDQLQSFRPFKEWMATLNRSLARQTTASHPFHADPYVLRSITVQSFDRFGGNRLGFVKLAASVSNAAGESLPGAALLRGPSVAVLFMLIPDDSDDADDERYAVMTVQPRIPAGSMAFAELPAGMVDDAGSFKGAAAKEMEEELGITITDDHQMTCLSELAVAGDNDEGLATAMFPSAGGCDEHVTLYSHERRVPRDQLRDWTGRLTGLRSEGEKITLKLVPMRDLWREGARDAKALGALALWEALRREGRL